jgi:predicted RNA-binding Zn-ribbon protein involved in translation (DUF1610 family)
MSALSHWTPARADQRPQVCAGMLVEAEGGDQNYTIRKCPECGFEIAIRRELSADLVHDPSARDLEPF